MRRRERGVKVKHTFRFEEGVWKAVGSYSDERGHIVSLKGESRLVHTAWNPAFFANEDRLVIELESGGPVEIKNKYMIKPFEKNRDYTSWTLDSNTMGKIHGKLVVAGDSVISTFNSTDGVFRGTEILMMIDEKTYRNRGCLFRGDRKISSWWVELKKIR